MTADFTAYERTAMPPSEARVGISNFSLLCLISFTICHRTNNTGLKHPDFFHTTFSINEVATERIIKCHLRMEVNSCFVDWAWLKALTCRSDQLCNSDASDLYLPVTHGPTHLISNQPQQNVRLTHRNTEIHLSLLAIIRYQPIRVVHFLHNDTNK